MSEAHEVTVEQEIANPRQVRPHLVMLGAGGSRAAFPNGDRNGRRLPVMADFVEVIAPLKELFEKEGINWARQDFESLYSEIVSDGSETSIKDEVENIVFDYFGAMELPGEATLYDALVLSLRDKDVIATFNWDPFLIQAYRRCVSLTRSLPYLLFLHGNVAHGFCARDRVSGPRGARCSHCRRPFEPDQLLYPVTKKDYSLTPSIAHQWQDFQQILKDALVVTIFGYGAPASDKDAIDLMSKAWGGWRDREFEEIEIIDIRSQEELRETWGRFIHTHHYEVYDRFWDSFLANHPRRSVEAFYNQFIEAKFISDNRIPSVSSLDELLNWFRPIVAAEERRSS